MKFTAWVSQNTDQSQAPGDSMRTVTLSLIPEKAGKKAEFAGGKLVGGLTLQNVPEELAAQFSGGQKFEIEVTPKN